MRDGDVDIYRERPYVVGARRYYSAWSDPDKAMWTGRFATTFKWGNPANAPIWLEAPDDYPTETACLTAMRAIAQSLIDDALDRPDDEPKGWGDMNRRQLLTGIAASVGGLLLPSGIVAEASRRSWSLDRTMLHRGERGGVWFRDRDGVLLFRYDGVVRAIIPPRNERYTPHVDIAFAETPTGRFVVERFLNPGPVDPDPRTWFISTLCIPSPGEQ